MAILPIGSRAPQFDLAGIDGARYRLDGAQLTLAIFFKTTCPTCQYAWQFYERIHHAYASAGLRVWGISQSEREPCVGDADSRHLRPTREFANKYGATFPHLLDEGWRVSVAYDPDFVPTAFLISRDGKIIECNQAWVRANYDQLGETIARELKAQTRTLIRPEENVLPFKAG